MKIDFMGNRYTCFSFSGVLIIISLVLLLVKGLHYGIDFRGGSIIRVVFKNPSSEEEIRNAFRKMPNLYFGPEQLIIQAVSGSQHKEFIIQYPAYPEETKDTAEIHASILKKLKEAIPFSDDEVEISNVGPTVGAEMRRQGLIAAFFAIIGILLYIAWRFEWQSAFGAVAALIHDSIITLGFISLMNIEFDVSVLASVLTLLGYSVNDSIVVLDRIRENRKLMRNSSLFDIINESINQTIGRTINTSATTLFTLVALLLFGGVSLFGFSAVLTFGVIVGTYSSIAIASPVLLHFTPSKVAKR